MLKSIYPKFICTYEHETCTMFDTFGRNRYLWHWRGGVERRTVVELCRAINFLKNKDSLPLILSSEESQ